MSIPEFNLRKASSSVPLIRQNNDNASLVRKEDSSASSLAMQILCPQDVTTFLCHLREIDVNWPINETLKGSVDKLFNYLKENPLSKSESQSFNANERMYLIGRTINAQGHPHTDLILDYDKVDAFTSSLMSITTNHCQTIPPKTRMGAQWCLMQIAIQSNCLKLALNIIEGFEEPLSSLKMGPDVQNILIGKSWEYLKNLNNSTDALAFVDQSTRVCGLHAINTPLMMAKFCQYRIEHHSENLLSGFKCFFDQAKELAPFVERSETNHLSYMRALIDLEDYFIALSI